MTKYQAAEIIGLLQGICIAAVIGMAFVIFHVIYQFRVSRAGRKP